MQDDFDLIVRRGLVVDGTGSEPFEGDIALSGGRIAAVGEVSGRGARRKSMPKGRLSHPASSTSVPITTAK